MSFTNITLAERPIVSRVQTSQEQQLIEQATLAAFESGQTLSTRVAKSYAPEVDRMIRKAVKLHGYATIVEIRETGLWQNEVFPDFEPTDEDDRGEEIVEVAFIVKRKRPRRKPGEVASESTPDTEDDDTIEDEDENDENNEG